MPDPTHYDVVVVGGGHNGLVAATLLARAGKSVAVFERRETLGGAVASERPFAGVDVRLSRYAYLISLFPRDLAFDLALDVEVRRRRFASYTPVGDGGVLIRRRPPSRGWKLVDEWSGHVARRVFPTLTEPLRSRSQLRAIVGHQDAWDAHFERPLGETLEERVDDDVERGIALTDGLIGTFASAHDPSLRQNRCFLYHVIGNGTGNWEVPVGGMGALGAALVRAATEAGVVLRRGIEVTSITPDGEVRFGAGAVRGDHVLAAVAPPVLARLLGAEPPAERPEGAQLKINMVLSRLPRIRDASVRARDALCGTMHVNEGYEQLERAYREAEAGRIPALPPCDVYCHSLSDPTIIGRDIRNSGIHTLTVFGLHMPARLFAGDPSAKERAVRATLDSLSSVLGERIENCILHGPDGEPCVEARTPLELEEELAMPGGHIFHGDLQWPFAEREEEVGTWGVETAHERILLCGAGARRGGGVSGIPGHNAAMAVLNPARDR